MFPFPFTLRRRSTRRLSVSITLEKGIVVTAPSWLPESQIHTFLNTKLEWIKKHFTPTRSLTRTTHKFINGEKFSYFGEEFPLHVTLSSTIKKLRLSLLYDTFEALVPSSFTPNKTRLELKLAFINWYLKQGKKVITQKVDYYSKRLGVSYNRIVIKRVSSIWGSCSRRNNLNFNRKLILAPHPIVDYVVIHEVSHLIHRHHQKSFWATVASLDPDYKAHVRWLKTNASKLEL